MKKWHITITEIEDGAEKTILDTDTNCIVAGIDEGRGTRSLQLTDCTVIDHAAVLHTLTERIAEAKKKHPAIASLMGILAERAESEEKKPEDSKE